MAGFGQFCMGNIGNGIGHSLPLIAVRSCTTTKHRGPKAQPSGPGFLLRILWCSRSDNNPEHSLAKFGYILHMEVGENKRILLYSWLHTRTCCGNVAIWITFFFSKIGKFGQNFSMRKILCIGWNHISQVQNWQKFTSKRNPD